MYALIAAHFITVQLAYHYISDSNNQARKDPDAGFGQRLLELAISRALAVVGLFEVTVVYTESRDDDPTPASDPIVPKRYSSDTHYEIIEGKFEGRCKYFLDTAPGQARVSCHGQMKESSSI